MARNKNRNRRSEQQRPAEQSRAEVPDEQQKTRKRERRFGHN
ncbi:hypothetical protein [Streptomyces sp. MP131-18]|nr:hypothetical protein [Streptomyces sp. MP131-18]ONK15047.1 hypothetical protein STBA_58600 [Streptomyces sp. MP131-18]